MFKDTLSIAPRYIVERPKLSSPNRSLAFAVRQPFRQCILTGTTYTIAFGNRNSEAVVELKKQDIYSVYGQAFACRLRASFYRDARSPEGRAKPPLRRRAPAR